MNLIPTYSISTIILGAVLLAAAFLLGRATDRRIPASLHKQWNILQFLIVFFLCGYFFFLFILTGEVRFPLEAVTSTIFLGGAVFVLLVVSISRLVITQISESEEEVAAVGEEMRRKNFDLEAEVERRREAERQANSRLRYLTTLQAIDAVVSASLDLRVTLHVFLDQVAPQLHVDAAAVFLLNVHTQTLEQNACKGFHTKIMENATERLGEGGAGMAAMERKTLSFCNLGSSSDPRQRRLHDAEGIVACSVTPLIARGQIKGALEVYWRSAMEPDQEALEFFEALAVRVAIAIDNATLFHQIQRSNAELILSYDTTIEGWARALELRDRDTVGHTRRVTDMTVALARHFGMSEETVTHVRRGAILHDIGKMAISDAILLKDGPLTDEERIVMQHHPAHAFEMLSPIVYLRPALDIPYCHHEKWDGSGYPRHLKGEQIPLAARIFAIADTWDALTSKRRYHDAWPVQRVCSHIESLSGVHFDPGVVKKFLAMEWCKKLAPTSPVGRSLEEIAIQPEVTEDACGIT